MRLLIYAGWYPTREDDGWPPEDHEVFIVGQCVRALHVFGNGLDVGSLGVIHSVATGTTVGRQVLSRPGIAEEIHSYWVTWDRSLGNAQFKNPRRSLCRKEDIELASEEGATHVAANSRHRTL